MFNIYMQNKSYIQNLGYNEISVYYFEQLKELKYLYIFSSNVKYWQIT